MRARGKGLTGGRNATKLGSLFRAGDVVGAQVAREGAVCDRGRIYEVVDGVRRSGRAMRPQGLLDRVHESALLSRRANGHEPFSIDVRPLNGIFQPLLSHCMCE